MTARERKVLIVEPNPTGHRLFYVRLIARAAHSRGDHVAIVLGREVDLDAERIHLGQLPEGVAILRSPAGSIVELADLAARLDVDIVVVPDGDRLALQLATRLRWSATAQLNLLVMRESAQPSSLAFMTKIKSFIRTTAFSRVAAMRQVRLVILKSAAWHGKSRFRVAIDPVQLTLTPGAAADFRRRHKVDGDRYWFGVVGAISSRKNLPLIMEALESHTRSSGLIVAGQLDDDVSPEVRRKLIALAERGLAVVVDKLLTDEELDAAVAATDCIVLAHSNEGPSGLLGKAAAIGTRIVAAGAESLRIDLQALPALGEWVPLNVQALSSAFDRAASLPAPSSALDESSEAFTMAMLQ